MSGDHFSVAHFENYLAKQDLAYRTIKGYLDDLRFFSQWYEEIQSKSIDYTKVTSFEIQAFRQYLVNAKRQKVSAVNRRIQALKRFFNWAHEQGFIPSENPVEHLRFMRRQSPTQPAALNKTEVHNLLRVAGQSSHGLAKRNYVILQLMLQCGLRASEIINLKYKDIKLQSRSGTLHVVDGKGHKSREVPMNVTVRRALTHYLEGLLTKEPDGPLIYRVCKTLCVNGKSQ